jgi:hypothetical protein
MKKPIRIIWILKIVFISAAYNFKKKLKSSKMLPIGRLVRVKNKKSGKVREDLPTPTTARQRLNPACGNKFVTVSVCGKYYNIRCTTLCIMVCIMFVPNMERTALKVIGN